MSYHSDGSALRAVLFREKYVQHTFLGPCAFQPSHALTLAPRLCLTDGRESRLSGYSWVNFATRINMEDQAIGIEFLRTKHLFGRVDDARDLR